MPDFSKPSEPFQRFLHAFFAPLTYETWHEGFDVQSLSRLSAEEQRLAEDILLQHLEQGEIDSRIVVGLGELRSQRAIPALTKRLQSSRGEKSVIEPAVALWQIAHSQEALSALIEALAGLPDFFGRMDAAIGLGDCRCQQAAQALQQALSDEAYLVRYHATNSLLMISSLWPHRKRGHPLAVKVMSDDPQKREATINRILALIKNRPLPRCEDLRERVTPRSTSQQAHRDLHFL